MLRNSLWNALGLIVPSLFAIPAMAVMARALGVEKFGIFMLTFSFLGYSGVFDGGLTRAVIRSIAMHDADDRLNREIVGTASWAVLALGAAGALLVFVWAGPIARVLRVSDAALSDATAAFRLMAVIIPIYVLSLVWFAYLEGKQQFARLNYLKTFTGLLIAALPTIAVLIRPDLLAALSGLLLARIATLLIAYLPCRRGLKAGVFSFDGGTLIALFRFGGWITVSNIISPLMVFVDRFILSNALGADRVAFYATPSEMIARMSVVPGAVARTIFPHFSKLRESADKVAASVLRGLLLVCVAIALPVFVFAEWILETWLGAPYGEGSAALLRVLLVGFIFNAVAQVPYSKIQAEGRSKATALVHAAELVPYLALLTFLIGRYGLMGAAMAWTLRVSVDYLALTVISRRTAART